MFGDIEGQLWLKTIAPHTVFFGYDDSTDTGLRESDMMGLINQWNQVVGYADYQSGKPKDFELIQTTPWSQWTQKHVMPPPPVPPVVQVVDQPFTVFGPAAHHVPTTKQVRFEEPLVEQREPLVPRPREAVEQERGRPLPVPRPRRKGLSPVPRRRGPAAKAQPEPVQEPAQEDVPMEPQQGDVDVAVGAVHVAEEQTPVFQFGEERIAVVGPGG